MRRRLEGTLAGALVWTALSVLTMCPLPPAQAQQSPAPDWRRCARDGDRCEFLGEAVVRYGAGATFFTKRVKGGTLCSSEAFGDPSPKIDKAFKACDLDIRSRVAGVEERLARTGADATTARRVYEQARGTASSSTPSPYAASAMRPQYGTIPSSTPDRASTYDAPPRPGSPTYDAPPRQGSQGQYQDRFPAPRPEANVYQGVPQEPGHYRDLPSTPPKQANVYETVPPEPGHYRDLPSTPPKQANVYETVPPEPGHYRDLPSTPPKQANVYETVPPEPGHYRDLPSSPPKQTNVYQGVPQEPQYHAPPAASAEVPSPAPERPGGRSGYQELPVAPPGAGARSGYQELPVAPPGTGGRSGYQQLPVGPAPVEGTSGRAAPGAVPGKSSVAGAAGRAGAAGGLSAIATAGTLAASGQEVKLHDPSKITVRQTVKDLCWFDSYGNGAGEVQNGCAPDREWRDAMCYHKCAPGETGSMTMCKKSCPDGYRSDPLTCWRDAKVIGADTSACPGYDKCGLTLARGCSKCPAGYTNDGCTCRIDAHTLTRTIRDVGVGVAGSGCGAGLEKDPSGALCYPKCKAGYHMVGPVCWADTCPADFPVRCGLACAVSHDACALSVLSQVMSPLEVVTNVVGAVVTGGGSTALVAGGKVAAAGAKVAVKAAGQAAIKTSISQAAKAAGKEVTEQAVSTAASTFASAELTGSFSWYDLDPTGVATVVEAYNKPICKAPAK